MQLSIISFRPIHVYFRPIVWPRRKSRRKNHAYKTQQWAEMWHSCISIQGHSGSNRNSVRDRSLWVSYRL